MKGRSRVTIAGIQTGVGKTTISIGIMGALAKKGLVVQPFKIGPDFIDPSYHSYVTGRFSRNLDSFILNKGKIIELFQRASRDADISIIEGVMGLIDGLGMLKASTIEVARMLSSPVILIIDVWGTSASSAAAVLGAKMIEGNIKGVILNKVASDKHRRVCEEAIKRYSGVKVIGAIPYDNEICLEERHLGLIPFYESRETKRIERIIKLVSSNVELESVIDIADSAKPLLNVIHGKKEVGGAYVKVGVAFDDVFNFYYWDAIDEIRRYGADIEFFSPCNDKGIPQGASAVYIGGGFPELHAERLEKNRRMLKSIKEAACDGIPILSECGGSMYLSNSIMDFKNKSHKMAGILDLNFEMSDKLTLSYVLAESVNDSILLKRGERMKGHEFHRSVVQDLPSDAKFAFSLRKGNGFGKGKDGIIVYNTLATYFHTHLAQREILAKRFVEEAIKYSRR